MSRKYVTLILSFVTLLLWGNLDPIAAPAEAGYAIYVDSVEAGPGSDVPVKFFLNNDRALTSLSIPIKYDPSVVALKSISFTDSRAQHIANKLVTPADVNLADGHFMVAVFQWLEDPIPAGDGLLFTALFGIRKDAAVGSLSALDTLFYPPAGTLEVVRADTLGGILPDFTAGVIVVGENNRGPAFASIPDQYVLEGDSLDLLITVSDPDSDPLTLAVTSKPAGATFMDNGDGTARFVWVPDYVGPNSADGSPIGISFWASDGDLSSQMDLSIAVLNRNRRPEITAPEEVSVEAGDLLQLSLSAFDPDFEPIGWTWSGLPQGAVFDSKNPGLLTWQSAVVDTGSYLMEFIAADPQGLADTTQILTVVRAVALYTLSIDSVQAFPNEDVDFNIVLDNELPVTSFDILFNHDPIALAYLSLINTDTRSESFEYFTVQTNYNGVAGNVRVTGIADMGGGTPGLEPGNGPIATGRLHTTGDLAFAGMSVPLTFQFLDAPMNDDNTLTDSVGARIEQTDIVYVSGSLSIHDVGQIRIGDINLNGLAAEIGDVIYFTNFFIYPSLYKFNALQYANSDVNRDNIAATVSDLVALINIVIGGASYGKVGGEDQLTATIGTEVSAAGTVFSYDAAYDIGAALVVFETELEISQDMITGIPNNMTLDFRQDGAEVKMLLYSLKGHTAPSGRNDLFVVAGLEDFEITHMELGSADGRLIEVSLMSPEVSLPHSYLLEQNYPNPFNPETVIQFALPRASEVSLTVFNVLGQQVVSLVSGEFPAGRHQVEWRGTDESGLPVASGIYFYRLVAGTKTMTRKMMLLK